MFNFDFNIRSYYTQVSIGLAVLCIPWLRWKHPEWERPIKVHLFWPIIYILATIFITVVPMIASPVETGRIFESHVFKIMHFNKIEKHSRNWNRNHCHRNSSLLHLCLLAKQTQANRDFLW